MINLKKGSSISLEKDGKKLENIYVGLNWGMISSFWGLSKSSVDLDGSASMFGADTSHIDTVYFRKKYSNGGSIRHSGDDLTGDSSDDNSDNEIISINLKKVSKQVETIVIFLNSYKKQEFHTIPYAKIRLLEGNGAEVKNVFATFNLASEPAYKGKVSMIMAKIVRSGDNWKFVTIGEAADTWNIKETVHLIRQQYL